MAKTAQTIKIIKDLILQGKGLKAQKYLEDRFLRALCREQKREVAWLARRAGRPELGLRLLNPIVRSAPRKPVSPTDDEKAEYGACLIKIGAVSEAQKILEKVSAENVPAVLLFKASAAFTRWEYSKSIPLLEKYIEASTLPHYQRLIGKVNLAAAYVHERQFEKARPLLKSLIAATKKAQLSQLYGNCLELMAQDLIFEQDWKLAKTYLTRAKKHLAGSATLDGLFVRKWEAVLELHKHGPEKKDILYLKGVRAEALQRNHWETVRECDLHEACALGDDRLFLRVYFGTPIQAYQRKAIEQYPHKIKLPSSYVWTHGPTTTPSVLLDTQSGKFAGRQVALKTGQLLHKLVATLSADFYRPLRVASLFGELHPGDFYNPNSSPASVHEAIKRLRQWLKTNEIPLSVQTKQNAYRLELGEMMGIQIQKKQTGVSKLDYMLSLLKSRSPEEPFTTKEVALMLGVSPRTASRLIKQGLEEGKLSQKSASSNTKFKLAS